VPFRREAPQAEHEQVPQAQSGGDVGRRHSGDAHQALAAVPVQRCAERALPQHGAHVTLLGATVRWAFVWPEQVADIHERL